jgi:hypothetical protein
VSRPFRIAVAACWLVVAFLLLRMAWGGSLFGIVYVVNFTHPAVLVAGAATIVGALLVAVLLARGASTRAPWFSIGLSCLAIPLSLVLATLDHGSAPAVGAAAAIAMALSLRRVLNSASSASPPPA